MYPCGSCLSSVPTSWELLLEPGEEMEGAGVPLSLQWKFIISFFSRQPFVLAARYQAGLSARAAGLGPWLTPGLGLPLLCKSALLSVNSCHSLIPLAQELRTGEGGTWNVCIRDLPGNCIVLFYTSQLFVSVLGSEYSKIPGYFTWAVGTIRLKNGGKN